MREMVFFATIGLLIIAVSIPIAAMYACGQFVGQKAPHALFKMAVMLAVGLGLFSAVVGAMLYARAGGMTVSEWVMLAWVAGSAVTGQVALQELLGRKPLSSPATD
ncbi:hypothetical protein EB230_30985 [Mesorhizobium sp. NZP2234]|nr:hypothetical protein EB230_30985 [Mesorhizobium sp. NZP2234]